jgi:hypothetical protein
MFRKALSILLVFGVSLFAKEYKAERAYKVTQADEDRLVEKIKNLDHTTPMTTAKSATAIPVGVTWYDYATNSVMGRMIAESPNGFHVAFMKIATSGATRYVTYDYYDKASGIFFGNQSVTEDRRTGWGRVVNGRDNEAIISLHNNPTQIWFDAGEANYSFTNNPGAETNPGVFAGIDREGDVLAFVSQGSSWTDGVFRYSTDYGATWTSNNNVILAGVTDYGNSERWPQIDPTNPARVTYLIGPADLPSNPDGSIHEATTTDAGATWTTKLIHDDAQVYNTAWGESQYIIENFTQWNHMYTQNGVHHAVFGAVQGIKDTTASTRIDYWPILYWNSVNNTMYQINDTTWAAPEDSTNMDAMAGFRPGNGLGNAYPHIAEGPDGDLLVVWQQWEANAFGKVVTKVGSLGNEIFMTDIWGAYSPDGGTTWSYTFRIAGTPGESDVFPNIPETFSFSGDSIVINLLWLQDPDPGVSLFASNNGPAEATWMFERVAINRNDLTFKPPFSTTGIGDLPGTVAEDFALSQNYPNPFNPSTTIEYSLNKPANVTLEVYNLVGQKVATLVNGYKPQGQYSVNFDAQNLSSGVYFYTLTSGDVKLTRKMLLMK